MGAGASMEDQPEGQAHSEEPRGRVVMRESAGPSRPMSRASSAGSAAWRAAMKNQSLAAAKARKLRAAALGRKSACSVTVDKTGFSLQHIQICEGQTVTFHWDDKDAKGFNITQVCHDGEQYKPVVGGLTSGPVQRRGFFEQQFNMQGEYKFVSAGLRCTPLTLEVYPRKEIEAQLSDEGFSPKLIRIDEGNTVRWSWSGCSVPHTLVEVRYSHKLGTVVQKDGGSRPIATKAGNFKKTFLKTGLYYFQTEGSVTGEMHSCIIHVRERQEEHRVEVCDRSFSPPVVVINEGDRVWWTWDKAKNKKHHCVYQIDPPPLGHPNDESYKPKRNGFKWPAPTRSGLLSHEFYEPGVYFFSDHNFDEAAEYVGTVIVKPKQKEHFVELTEEGFAPDLATVETGDRIWWTWTSDDMDQTFKIQEIEKCVSPVGARPSQDSDSAGEGSYMDEALEDLKKNTGLDTVMVGGIGVYHYKVTSDRHIATCSIVAQPGPRNHTVHVTDKGFEPKVVTIHPGDRVWWVWQEGGKQHNITQVTHQGSQIKDGFCSGAPLDCPAAHMVQFDSTGVQYYVSEALPKTFGAVVITSQPCVHDIEVSGGTIKPDPVSVAVNDVVAWTFRGLKQNDLVQVETKDQAYDAITNSPATIPRRCMNRLFTEKGVFHFSSKSFTKQSGGKKEDDLRVSSVLVDEISDSATVRVDGQGFHPKDITVKKGQSVLWSWKESGEEAHNIIHVNPPNSDAPLNEIRGGRSFNSGRPVPQNSFLYTFDDPGTTCVASQGAPGFAGTINVLDNDNQAAPPSIVKGCKHGGLIEQGQVVRLTSATPNAKMYYTLDGTAPEIHRLSTKSYNEDKGIKFKRTGLCFIRAFAIADKFSCSAIFTSRRYWVGGDDDGHHSEPEPEPEPKDDTGRWHWWNCVPSIKAVFTHPGVMEVFWDPPAQESRFMLKGYQLFLNGVSYCEMFPGMHTSVSVAGLAGGRMYEVYLEAYPTDTMFLPHKSNKLQMKCAQSNSTGGPVISLETTKNKDAMAIVWLSISTSHSPIEGYRVYLNGQMCGNQVVPDADSDRCKVVIEGCQISFPYQVVVHAVPAGGGSVKQSNELEVTLPLDVTHMTLPPPEARADDEDMYKEYIEVREGGYEDGEGDFGSEPHQEEVPMLDFTDPESAKMAAIEEVSMGDDVAMETENLFQSHSPSAYGDETDMSKPDKFDKPKKKKPRKRKADGAETLQGAARADPGEQFSLGGTSRYRQDVTPQDSGRGSYQEGDRNHGNSGNYGYNGLGGGGGGYGLEGKPPPGPSSRGRYSPPQPAEVVDDDLDYYRKMAQKSTPTASQMSTPPPPIVMNTEYSDDGRSESSVSSHNYPPSPVKKPHVQQPMTVVQAPLASPPMPQKLPKPLTPPMTKIPASLPSPLPPLGVKSVSVSAPVPCIHAPLPSQFVAMVSSGHSPSPQVSHFQANSADVQTSYTHPTQSYSTLPAAVFPPQGPPPHMQSFPNPTHQPQPPPHMQSFPNPTHQPQPPPHMQSFPNPTHQPQPPTHMQSFPDPTHQPQPPPHMQSFPDPTHQPQIAQTSPPHPPPQLYPGSAEIVPSTMLGKLSRAMIGLSGAVSRSKERGINRNIESGRISLGRPPLPPSNNLPMNVEITYPPELDITRPPSYTSANGAYPNQFVDMSKANGHSYPHQPHLGGQYPPSGHDHTPGNPGSSNQRPEKEYITNSMLPPSGHFTPGEDSGFIDATLDPWKNKMKTVAVTVGATKRMSILEALQQKAKEEEYAKSPNGHYEVEVDDSEDSCSIRGSHGRSKKRGTRTAVVEVADEAHIQADAYVPPQETQSVVASVPVLGVHEGDDNMPMPHVVAENIGLDSVRIKWNFKRSAEPTYRLIVSVVNVVGSKFHKDVNSDISFECLMDDDGAAVPALQHCWNVVRGTQCDVRGLLPAVSYQIYVVATYSLVQTQQPCEIQAKSQVIRYTTLGPPTPPKLSAAAADLNQVTLAWESGEAHKEVRITGFRVLIDDQPLGSTLNDNVRQTIIDNLHAGRTIRVAVSAVTDHPVGPSAPSNTIKVVCPQRPPAPHITQQPSYKQGSIIIGWERPPLGEAVSPGEDIIFYRVFLDQAWHGEVRATATGNRNGYQYCLNDLRPGLSYDVNVKAYSGQRSVDPAAQTVYCLCESDCSNTVPAMCPAPPCSPHLRLDGMHLDGVDVTWEMPQQFGDAEISGYQMMKDGKLYGSIIPPEVHSLRIKGLTLGERVDLQILALTDHPVGRDTGGNTEGDGKVKVTKDGDPSAVFVGDCYSACQPGPKLVIHYTGLVQPPAKVWCEQVTGHSAMMVWSKDERPREHFVGPESYQVTWWPGDTAEMDVQSAGTRGDHLLITGLLPHTTYHVVVEARKMQKYSEVNEGNTVPDDVSNTFILTAKSDHLTLKTASPPQPVSNLGVVATTCHSIQVSWDPPLERGIEVIGIRVDAVAIKSRDDTKHACAEVLSDATCAVVEGLAEKIEYLVSVTCITEEYFDQLPEGHEYRGSRTIPKFKIPKDDPWLPSTSVIAMTSGTDPPADVKVSHITINSVKLSWKPPKVYGSNRLQGTVVRWAEGRNTRKPFEDEASMAHHRSITADSHSAVIEDLQPGLLYKFVVEAVVSVKTTMEANQRDPEMEKANRRTTHVMSKPVLVRTRAPCEPPRVLITGFTTNTIQLYWEKPLLYSVNGTDEDDNPKYLKLALEGYRLEINGKPHMRLTYSAQSCTLIKCKPGKTYRVVLVALTCTEDVKRERKRKARASSAASSHQDDSHSSEALNCSWHSSADDLENSESPSAPLEVTLPREHDGFLGEVNANFLYPTAQTSGGDCGEVMVDWAIQNNSNIIRQFNVSWRSEADNDAQCRVINNEGRNSTIAAQHRKTVYDIFVNPDFEGDVTTSVLQKVQCMIPGPPDAPQIWLKSVENSEFILEWGEPRLWGVKVAGYQVYLNDKKVGNQLNSHHRKAVIPCKPKRHYKVNLVALSADSRFTDSTLSNTVMVNTGGRRIIESEPTPDEEDGGMDSSELAIKVVRVTDTTIHLDWSHYMEVAGMMYYRVVWSSVTQPAEREVKLPAGERSCVIHKCYPGTNHFLRLYAMGNQDSILDRSSQHTVQTSAAPDTPHVTLRSRNFKYIAIEWVVPATYGDSQVTGYKVYVNGVVEGLISADTTTFSFTHGHWCREYAFQVQALTSVEKLHSKPSDPLLVTWPGIQPPVLHRAPSASGNAVKITWNTPVTSEGTKIKLYKLVVLEERSERPVQIVSPIHADSCEAEVHNLKTGSYMLYLECHVHGCTDVVKTDLLHIQPLLQPDPPHISVTVIGLEERRQIEKITSDLVNKRDKLLNILASRETGVSSKHTDEEQVLARAAESLHQVEEMLDDCLASLMHYTGHLLAHVSWTCPQSQDIQVSGYKVLVDGKQYGTTLHAGIHNVRVKLGLTQASHMVSLVSVCDRPHVTSAPSNTVELITQPFLPYSFFSFFSQASPNCAVMPVYQEALKLERKLSSRRSINQGLLRRQVPPPSCTLLDIFEGEYHPLFPPSGPRLPTAILFWAKWNPYAVKTLSWFVKFAKENSSQFEFTAVACEPRAVTPSVRQGVVSVISENGWREDRCVRHVISQALHTANSSPAIEERKYHTCYAHLLNQPGNNHKRNDLDPQERKESVASADITELFGVSGVPTIVIVHPQDYIAWKGRYAAFDYSAFENFMRYVFAQSLQENVPTTDPWDTAVDRSALEFGERSHAKFSNVRNGKRLSRSVSLQEIPSSKPRRRPSTALVQVPQTDDEPMLLLDDDSDGTKKYYSDKDLLIHRPVSGNHRSTRGSSATTFHLHGGTQPPPANKQKLFYKTDGKHEPKINISKRPYSASSVPESPYSQRLTPSPTRRIRSGRKAKNSGY